MCSCYRMKYTGTWRNGVKTGHTRMAEVMGSQIPISNMRGDSMLPKYSFGRNYSVSIQTRSNWQQGIDPPVPKGAITLVAKIVDTLQLLANRHSNFDCTAKIYLFNDILQITHCIFFVVGGCACVFLLTVSKECFIYV